MNILDDITKLMTKYRRWNEETITNVSKEYNSRMDFKKGHRGAYNAAVKLKLLDKLFPK